MTDEFITYFNAYFEFAKPYRGNTYGVRKIGSNKYLQPLAVFTEFCTYMGQKGQPAGVSLEEVTAYINEHTPTEQQEERKPCRQWIMDWIRARRENWQFNGSWSAITYYFNGMPHNKTLEDVKDALMETVYQEQLPYRVEEVKTTLNCIARDD